MPRRALGHSPLLHMWAGSSVTLTEELLKPKWAVRSVLQDRGQVTLRAYTTSLAAPHLFLYTVDLELTCGSS